MLFYGSKASKNIAFVIRNIKCEYCQQSEPQHVTVFNKYAHLYWIPFFPLAQIAVSECTHCKRTIAEKDFSEPLRREYDSYKPEFKKPLWQWTGLGLVGLVMVMVSIIGKTADQDPRRKMLKADIDLMTANPDAATDSFSVTLKALFNDFAGEEIHPSEFEYRSKVNDDKVLILVKIPKLKSVKKDARTQIINVIEMLVKTDESLKDKKLYIGIHGNFNMMMLKTPTESDNKNIISEDPLYEFYGPKT